MLRIEMGGEYVLVDPEDIGEAMPLPHAPRSEDLPYFDFGPMESETHVLQIGLLAKALKEGWKARTDFYVGQDMFVYYTHAHVRKPRHRGPDVFVAVGVSPKSRKKWVVWEENHAPDVIVEVTSKSTEHNDRGIKMNVYERVLRVPAYYIYDPEAQVLDGYLLDPKEARYRPLERDEHGQLACPPLGLYVGYWDGVYETRNRRWLRWFDKDRRPIPILAEQEAKRADREARRADEEARRADEEARRADEEARRADEEARARRDAEAKIAELQALLKKDGR